MNEDNRITLTPGSGQSVLYTMPFSEVCVHMNIAGKPMWVELLDETSVQLYDLNHRLFSFPISYSDAGIYRRGDELYVYLDDDESYY